jgi:hypothetical protein
MDTKTKDDTFDWVKYDIASASNEKSEDTNQTFTRKNPFLEGPENFSGVMIDSL